MTKAAPAAMTTPELLGRLRRHYLKPGAFPGGVFVTEVGVNGPGTQRRCDALHVGFTQATGRMLTGHELKVSRSDWLHELASPGKADQWADQCHAWYVVAPSAEVVRPDELPPGWGLLVPGPSKTAMVRKVRAREDHERTPAWWAVRSLLARNDTLMEQTIAGRADTLAKAQVAEQLRRERERASWGAERTQVLAQRLAAELSHGPHYLSDDEVVAAVHDLVTATRTVADAKAAARHALQYLDPASKQLRALIQEAP